MWSGDVFPTALRYTVRSNYCKFTAKVAGSKLKDPATIAVDLQYSECCNFTVPNTAVCTVNIQN